LVLCCANKVAGYYDPKEGNAFWTGSDGRAGTVWIIELTHALRIRRVASTMDEARRKGLGENQKDPTLPDIENDEIDDSREAVVEGQAETVMCNMNWHP